MNNFKIGVLIGVSLVGGFAIGYSKAREKFLEAMIMATTKSKETES